MAEAQSFKNHTRWDPLLHFIIVPLNLLIIFFAAKSAMVYRDRIHHFYLAIGISLFLIALKARLYALKNQDRIIRLEERIRLYLLMPSEGPTIDALTVPQYVGLRFASDAEVCGLARAAVRENLTSKQIKERIQTWRADNHRA